jgi:hypothetical protein
MFLFSKATRCLEPISYKGALLSTLLHATVYMFLHNSLNALVHIVNKMGLQKQILERYSWIKHMTDNAPDNNVNKRKTLK